MMDTEDIKRHPNKLVALWCMADFMRKTVEELIAKEELQKSIRQHHSTDDDEGFNL